MKIFIDIMYLSILCLSINRDVSSFVISMNKRMFLSYFKLNND